MDQRNMPFQPPTEVDQHSHFRAHDRVEALLQQAGICLNGNQPWDMCVHDDRVYSRILAQGSLGLGESYMDGWWDCEQLDEFAHRTLRANLEQHIGYGWYELWQALRGVLANLQSQSRAFIVGQRHYDLSNQLYACMLDSRMTYTCGYWTKADNLDEAQEHKLDLVCRKIGLQPGQRVLDIGCGWGSFAQFAAERYGARVVGVTISREQAELARLRCRGLPVEIRLQDYRDVHEPFEHIVSLGMFEHVGWKNYRTYLAVVKRCLLADGLFLLHCIGANESRQHCDPWIERHIFPNGGLPSISQLGKAMEQDFVMEDWHNFGTDYDDTLRAWHANFEQHWSELSNHFDQRFYRMWRYYLLMCAGAFRARKLQLWQVVMSQGGLAGGYLPQR